MNARKTQAVASAWRWLARAPLASSDIEKQLQRLFALASASVLNTADDRCNDCLRLLASTLPSFDYRTFSGDPIVAVAVQRTLSRNGIKHDSLCTLASAYAAGLADAHTALDPEMTLLALLCDTLDNRATPPGPVTTLAGLDIAEYARTDLIGLCRTLTLVTACGTYPIELGPMRVVLPCLSVSSSRDWDLELTSWVLRACAFLKLNYGNACVWSTEWLLDQQQTDGRFGLLAPEAHRDGRDSSDWSLHFELTVGALWTLAELEKPGFMLTAEF
jgi:hypothetical protein